MARGEKRRRTDGFTLVESVTALFVFSTAAIAVIELNTGNARAMGQIESAVYARIVADNQIALAVGAPELPRGDASGEEEMAGRAWSWSRVVAATVDPDMDRVDVVVRLKGEERVAAALTGFRGRR